MKLSKLVAFTFFVSSLFFASNIFAMIQEPRSISSHGHIKEINYNPNGVHKYTGFYGYQSSIVFDRDEEIDTISMGNSTGWQIVPKANRLFLKPISDDATTNATIITNMRIYHLQLYAEETNTVDDPKIAYELRFRYPESNIANDMTNQADLDLVNTKELSSISEVIDPSYGKNLDYTVIGSAKIIPAKVFDDGKFTYMHFPGINAVLPAVLALESDGVTESLVNFRTQAEYIVIDMVNPIFALRSGVDAAFVYNNSIINNKNTLIKKQQPSRRKGGSLFKTNNKFLT